MKYSFTMPDFVLSTMPSGSIRLTVASLYSLPRMVRKSSARVSDADSAAKIDSAVFQYFTGGGFCLFCSPHGNDNVIETHEHAGDFKEW